MWTSTVQVRIEPLSTLQPTGRSPPWTTAVGTAAAVPPGPGRPPSVPTVPTTARGVRAAGAGVAAGAAPAAGAGWIVQRRSAVTPALPAASIWRTSRTWPPTASPVRSSDGPHVVQAPPSRRHWRVAPGSPAKAKPDVPGRTVPSGPATIVGAAGRPVSTTHWWTVAGDQLPAPSPWRIST